MTTLPITQNSSGSVLSVKVLPKASRNQIGAIVAGQLKISVTAPPVDGQANLALVKFLAGELNCSRAAVTILRGETSRNKLVAIHGLAAEDVYKRLGLNTP